MSHVTAVPRTRRVLSQDLKPGDHIAAALNSDDPYQVTLYLVEEVIDNREGQETMTVRLRYDYSGNSDPEDTRVEGIRRMDCVTVL